MSSDMIKDHHPYLIPRNIFVFDFDKIYSKRNENRTKSSVRVPEFCVKGVDRPSQRQAQPA